MKQCSQCGKTYEEPGVPHPVRWSDTKCKFVAELNIYCSWSCAYQKTKRSRSDHLMGVLNFMFMHYSQAEFCSHKELKNFPDPEHALLLSAFLKYCIPYTQIITMAEINCLESIQENKYLKSLYRKRPLVSTTTENISKKITKVE